MAKLVIFDIGTHKAEELRVLCGDRFYMLGSYLLWWFDWGKRVVKRIIKHKGRVKYGVGGYIVSPAKTSVGAHLRYWVRMLMPKNYLRGANVISIDPLACITARVLPRLENKINLHYIPIAILPHDDESDCRISKFFIEKSTISSSLFKPNRKGGKMTICAAFNLGVIIEYLKAEGLLSSVCKVIVRMNCEGSELAVIRELLKHNIKPVHVLGSIGDIKKKYGLHAENLMTDLLSRHNVDYCCFKGSDPGTWDNALSIMCAEQEHVL